MDDPIRILYIDDSPLDQELVKDMLEKEHGGFVVTAVGSREELDRILLDPCYDLLLTDFNILGFDGLQVFDLIQETMPRLPVIILTGTGSEEIAVEAMRRGVSDYVVKSPAHIRRLPQTVVNVLEKKRLEEEREKARQALRESQKSVELAIEGADLGFWDWNIQTGEAVLGGRAREMLGLQEEDGGSALQTCHSLVHPDDWQAFSDSLAQHRDGVTDSFEAEFRVRNPSGHWQWILGRGRIVELDPDGTPLRMAGTIVDITSLKKAEAGLAETLEQLKRAKTETEALLEASRALLVSKSFEFAARRIFESCKRVIGADAGYVTILKEDGPDNEILLLDPGRNVCTVDPQIPMPIRGLREQAVKTGRPVYENQFSNTSWNRLLPHGHVILENVLFAPLSIEGTVVGLLGIANKPGGFNDHDADLAKAFAEFAAIGLLNAKSDEALQESELKYRTLIDSLPICVAIFQDERIAFVNRAGARMLGHDDPAELVGSHVLAFVSDSERDRLSSYRRGRTDGVPKTPTNYTTELMRSTGEPFPAEVFFESITYRGDRAEQVIAIDISERTVLEDQLRHAQKLEAVGTLAGGIAHDFNNLLQIISGHAELLSMELREKNVGHDELRAILYSAERGAELVNDILTFSRKLEPDFRVADLNELVRMTERILFRTIPKMIEIELNLGEPLKAIQADKLQIEQLLLNLAVNAKDAMPDGGKLIFNTRNVHLDDDYCNSHLDIPSGDYVMLQIIDNGCGMDQETVSRIFEPFYTTKEPGEGTGLGLSTVFGIVKMHKGHIHCYSEPGEGTSFKIYFPAAQAQYEHDVQEEQTMPTGGTETILVVDDEELIAALAKRLLERAGYKVLTAVSGKEALEIYQREGNQIGLVILDLIMPEMGGKECLEQLLKINPQVKTLIASGFAVTGETKEFLKAVSTGTVSKPFKVREMLRTVRRALDGTPRDGSEKT